MTFKGKRRQFLDVCAKRCDQCLFSSAKIVDDVRKAEILEKLDSTDTHFTCHKHTIAGRDVMCRGDYDRDPTRTPQARLGKALGLLRLINEDGTEQDRT